MSIDNIKQNGTFSCLKRIDGVNVRKAFTPCDSLQDVIDFMGNDDDIEQVKDIWTDEVVNAFRAEVAATEAIEELQKQVAEVEAAAKQEMFWAEEQAHIENIVRSLINTDKG